MNILSELMRGVWLMDSQYAQGYYPMALNLITGQNTLPQSQPGNQSQIVVSHNGKALPISINDIVYDYGQIEDNSIFMMNITGPITKHDQLCGPYGMATKANWLKFADAHPKVIAHVLKIDSGGGEGYACQLMQTAIQECEKPVYAFVEGYAASAAYWIACAADKVFLSGGMDRIGSIGTYVTVADFEKYWEKKGIKLRDIYADKSKADKNQDYLQALQGKDERMQTLVNEYNEFFLQSVKNNRADALKSPESKWGTGKMFFAQEAVTIGLADGICSLNELFSSIISEHGNDVSASQQSGTFTNSTTTQTPFGQLKAGILGVLNNIMGNQATKLPIKNVLKSTPALSASTHMPGMRVKVKPTVQETPPPKKITQFNQTTTTTTENQVAKQTTARPGSDGLRTSKMETQNRFTETEETFIARQRKENNYDLMFACMEHGLDHAQKLEKEDVSLDEFLEQNKDDGFLCVLAMEEGIESAVKAKRDQDGVTADEIDEYIKNNPDDHETIWQMFKDAGY